MGRWHERLGVIGTDAWDVRVATVLSQPHVFRLSRLPQTDGCFQSGRPCLTIVVVDPIWKEANDAGSDES